MPIYEYKCSVCKKIYEEYRPNFLLSKDDFSMCCGVKANRIISSSQGNPVVMEYYSENAGVTFTGPRQKARILKEKGLTEIGDAKISGLNHRT